MQKTRHEPLDGSQPTIRDIKKEDVTVLTHPPYSFTKEDIIKGLQQVNQVEESPMGIVSLKPLSYWELKVLDLIEEVKTLIFQ